jgi:hypothetical protein
VKYRLIELQTIYGEIAQEIHRLIESRLVAHSDRAFLLEFLAAIM